MLERQENQNVPGKSGFCDGIQVWLFHFHFTFQRKQKLGQTTATGFISLVTSVKVSQHWLHFTGIIKSDRILQKFCRFGWEKNLAQIKQGLCEGGEDCTGTASLRLLLQPHCRASVRAEPRHKAEEITSVQTEGLECISGNFLKAEVGQYWLRRQAELANPSWTEGL